MISKLESDLFQFLWNKKTDKVARKQVIQTYLDGGINMLHVKSFLKSMKISWMKRLLSCNSTWTKILEHILKIKKDFFFTLGPEFSKMVAKKYNECILERYPKFTGVACHDLRY